MLQLQQLLQLNNMKAEKNQWSLKTVIDNCEFTSLDQKEISPRYTESIFRFSNDADISGDIYTFITQDIEVSRMNMYSANDAGWRHVGKRSIRRYWLQKCA